MNKTMQHGVGLVEVLVAVLLLSVAVLGFSALQVRAVSATDESLVRTKSLTIVRNLAEVMRTYPNAYVTGSGASFTTELPTKTGAIPIIQAIVSSSATDNITIDNAVITRSGCLSDGVTTVDSKQVPNKACNTNQLATRDALVVKAQASVEDIKLAVVTCPGTNTTTTTTTTTQVIQRQMCIVTAWNDTKAMLDATDVAACADANGVYKTGSQCLISEAY